MPTKLISTPWGNINQNGGFAVTIDGQVNAGNTGAYKTGASGYIGQSFPSSGKLTQAKIRGWSNRGLVDDGESGTLELYAKAGAAPTGETDGTLIASLSFTEGNGSGSVPWGSFATFNVTDQTNYDHAWVRIVGNATGVCVDEIEVYFESAGQGGGNPPPAEECERPFAIILVDGQSNAVGAAPVPAQTIYANRAKVYNFALDGTIKAAAEPLIDTAGSLWSAFNNTTIGCSPVMSMANALLDRIGNYDILICVSAKGSTSHYDWAKGGTLYTNMLDREQDCIAAAIAARPGSFVLAKVMYQAESSTDSTTSATNWKDTLPTRVADRRNDLGLPDLPVLIAGLGMNPYGSNATNAPAWPQLRLDQMTMDLPAGVFYVGISDLPSSTVSDIGADITNTDTVVEFGKRWAAALWNRLPDYVRRML